MVSPEQTARAKYESDYLGVFGERESIKELRFIMEALPEFPEFYGVEAKVRAKPVGVPLLSSEWEVTLESRAKDRNQVREVALQCVRHMKLLRDRGYKISDSARRLLIGATIAETEGLEEILNDTHNIDPIRELAQRIDSETFHQWEEANLNGLVSLMQNLRPSWAR